MGSAFLLCLGGSRSLTEWRRKTPGLPLETLSCADLSHTSLCSLGMQGEANESPSPQFSSLHGSWIHTSHDRGISMECDIMPNPSQFPKVSFFLLENKWPWQFLKPWKQVAFTNIGKDSSLSFQKEATSSKPHVCSSQNPVPWSSTSWFLP